MDGYLLDTCVLIDMINAKNPGHDAVWRRFRELPEESPIYTSSVVLGKLYVGPRLYAKDAEAACREISRHLSENGIIPRQITDHTANCYSELKTAAMRKYDRDTVKSKNRAKWPEDWAEPSSGRKLGVDENDMWIAAQAIEQNLVLVTNDRLDRLRDVAEELRVEKWR